MPLRQKGVRLDEHLQQIGSSEADLARGHAEDARIARPKHLDPGAAPQAEFFQPVHVVGLSGNPAYTSRLTGRQIAQRDRLVNHDAA